MQDLLKSYYSESIQIQVAASDSLRDVLVRATELLVNSLLAGQRVFSCGDGQSLLVANHFADLLLQGSELERPPFPALALGASPSQTSQLECISRQVTAIGSQGDILVAFISEEHSERVHQAMEAALSREMTIIAITGTESGEATGLLGPEDVEIQIPATNPARITEQQLFISHLLCNLIEQQIFGGHS
ncbi:phosphoheptose isomerase [Aliidiomarina minuta]|uniref:Phosphoheptose isomerase n=1 Tax=Aliidiomarina minuta TaxID=880057 RepID=A0A432W904_9GAMM|nr:SIS domain-containing protein [Aliidiomarina minuta]RUO26633.1 phosphoheptose isomerase [Aliidiomarina minuta]